MQIPGTLGIPSQRSVEANKAIFVVSPSDQRIIPNEVCPVLRSEPTGKHIHCETNLLNSLEKESPLLDNVGQKMAVPPAPPSPRFMTDSDEHWPVIRHGSSPRRSLSVTSSSNAADDSNDAVADNDRWFMSSPKSAASPRKPVRKTFPSASIVSPPSRWNSPQDSSPKFPRRVLSRSSLISTDTAALEGGVCSAGSLPSPPMVRLRKDSDGVNTLTTENMYISSVWLES